MAAGFLQAWLGGTAERLVWIDFAAYAHSVFARGSAQWLTDANVYVGAVSQAQAVIKTQVLSVDIIAPYLALLEPGHANPGRDVQALLQAAAAESYVRDVIDALAHRFAAKLDIMLTVPSPGSLLRTAGLEEEPSFDDLDDVGIALSGVLRKLSDKPVSGVTIAASCAPSGDEAEAMESITSAARHYGWRVALCDGNSEDLAPLAPALAIDVMLYPQVDVAAVIAARSATAVGGGLGRAYWGGEPASLPAGRCLLFGEVPADAEPEAVVKRAALAAS